MEVLGQLLPPITLKYFELRGYSSVSFPGWVMPIAQYLPNIIEFWMCDLPKCNRLPPLGQLPNLKELHIWGIHSITRIEGEPWRSSKAIALVTMRSWVQALKTASCRNAGKDPMQVLKI
jgi:hypothetical protein